MGEGYWIASRTGHFERITEHAQWIQVPDHARRMGLTEEGIARLAALTWDRGDGPGREVIVREACAQGLIRYRDHGPFATFEFSLPLETALQALAPFMAYQLGPRSNLRLNRLDTVASWAFTGAELMAPDRPRIEG